MKILIPLLGNFVSSQDFSLCDVADGRMMAWLEDVVEEKDFRRMEQFGVEVVRVPTGYWNWISLGDLTPNAPPEVAERFRNLQILEPWRYEKYIDLIYQEIHPGFALIGRALTLLCSHWSRASCYKEPAKG